MLRDRDIDNAVFSVESLADELRVSYEKISELEQELSDLKEEVKALNKEIEAQG